MKRKKKVLQFFLASALACLAWLAVPGADVWAGGSTDESTELLKIGGDADLSVTDENGETQDVSLTKKSNSWYEKNAGEFSEKDEDGKVIEENAYYGTSEFEYETKNGKEKTKDVGIGLTSSGDIVTVNSDAWAAVDTSVIDDSGSWTGEALKTAAQLSTSSCSGTSGCTCGSGYDCTKTCAKPSGGSDGYFTSGCIGHGWQVIQVGEVQVITRGGVTMYARPVLVQCLTSKNPCYTIETIWLVCTEYGDDNPPDEDDGDPVPKSDPVVPSDGGSATYTAVYPGGTTHGRSTIKVAVPYYEPTKEYKVVTQTAASTGKVTVYDPSTNKTYQKAVAKGQTYSTVIEVTNYHEDLNQYTVVNKGSKSKSSGLFWAEFIHTYAAGDSSGSTRAVNVPTGKTETFLNYSSNPPVGYVFKYSEKPSLSISVPFDVKTPVTAKDKGGMYREGYWTDGWTINGGIWNFGETRTTLPGGSPMASGTLTAHWIAETYTVIFDPNTPSNATHAASVSMTSTTATFDAPVSLATASLTGWIFDGWYTASGQAISGSTWTYDPNPTVGNEGHPDTVTLYAHWTPITYTVVLNGNRPSISIQPLQHFVSSSGLFTWAGSTYTATFTYDSPSDIPVVASMYGMQGWTTTDGWYRVGNPKEPYVAGIATGYAASYTYRNTSPGMNDSGHGSAKWNLTTENGATVNLYAGWYEVYGTQSDRIYDMTRILTYNGTTTLYGWSRDYSLANGLSTDSQKQTVEMTLKIDQRRGFGTGRLNMLLTFNDDGGHYASTATEKDTRYGRGRRGNEADGHVPYVFV